MITQREHIKEKNDSVEMRVASSSPAEKLAGAIVKFSEEGKRISLLAMGAGAVNQAVKGIIIARSIFASRGQDMDVVPGFTDQITNNVHKSAIRFYIFTGE